MKRKRGRKKAAGRDLKCALNTWIHYLGAWNSYADTWFTADAPLVSVPAVMK